MKIFYPEGDFERVCERYSDPAAFLELMDENGVDYTVVLAELSPETTGIATNEEVLEFCSRSPRLIPFCNVNPGLSKEPGRELRRWAEEGFRGLKLYPTYQHFYPNDRALYPMYEAAQELRMPVLFHTGTSVFRGSKIKYGEPLHLDDLAVDFPDLPLVMAHSGRTMWYEQAFTLARLHPNLYMEISGLPPKNLLNYFPALERNAGKIIFGSDWPGMPGVKRNLDEIRSLPLKGSTISGILGGTAARLLGLPE